MAQRRALSAAEDSGRLAGENIPLRTFSIPGPRYRWHGPWRYGVCTPLQPT